MLYANAAPPARPRSAASISIGRGMPAPSQPFTIRLPPGRRTKLMSQPLRFLNSPAQAAAIVARFAGLGPAAGNSYATVRDFCESADELPQITALDGDLKNVQRPWAAKTILAN